jgi:ornithine cyclodeaminase
MPILLRERDVRAVLPMPDLIDAMERAVASFSAGRADQPVRTVIEVGPDRNFFGVMPVALADPAAVGAKLVTVYHRNHDRGLPSHLATILLLDPDTGALVALMDGRYITEARTAAVSAVSVKHLALPDAASLALIGSGVQARSHLEAIRHVRPLDDVRVWSPDEGRRRAFATDMSRATGLEIRPASDAAAAVRGARIVVLATSSTTPVIEDDDIGPGTHIAAVGACRPDQREMPTGLVGRARLFVDSKAGAMAEAGDVLLAIEGGALTEAGIAGELGALVNGGLSGRTSPDDVTIFKSLGMAVEDIVAASLAVERARAQRIGDTWEIDG